MKRIAFALAATLFATPVLALEPIGQNKHIVDTLVAGRVADEIRSTCDSISPRFMVVMGMINDLKAYAAEQGYSKSEVDSFLEDKAEKTRLKGLAAEYLAKAGAVDGNEESFCKVGRDEIARKTLIGSMLRG